MAKTDTNYRALLEARLGRPLKVVGSGVTVLVKRSEIDPDVYLIVGRGDDQFIIRGRAKAERKAQALASKYGREAVRRGADVAVGIVEWED